MERIKNLRRAERFTWLGFYTLAQRAVGDISMSFLTKHGASPNTLLR